MTFQDRPSEVQSIELSPKTDSPAPAQTQCVAEYLNELTKSDAPTKTQGKEPHDGQLDFSTPVKGLDETGIALAAQPEAQTVGAQQQAPETAPEGTDAVKPETPAPFEKVEAGAENVVKVKTAEDAQKLLDRARKENLPLVAHASTVICTETSCTMTSIPPALTKEFGKQAIFMEVPRGGLKLGNDASAELKSINEKFKVTDTDHKTKVDAHVFDLKADRMVDYNRTPAGATDLRALIADQVKKRTEK